MDLNDPATGQWYYVVDKQYANMVMGWRDNQELREYNKLERFPLHDLADRDDAFIIYNTSSRDAIFATPIRGSTSTSSEETELNVKMERHIILHPRDPVDGYISDTIYRLALLLRNNEMTDKHLAVYKRLEDESDGLPDILKQKMSADDEFKASLDALKQKMKDMVTEVIAQDPSFVQAVKICLGESFLENVWVLIRNFFRHGYIGTALSSEQTWIVD